MDPNMNSQDFQPPSESVDNYHSFGSNPPQLQDSAPRFRPQGHYQGPYPTSNPRMRQHGDFQQRGRFSHNRRGGGAYRPQNREKHYDQQQEQSLDNNGYPTTTYPSNRNFNKFSRTNMLEDPWANMKPRKVPSDGTTLVFDSTNQ